MTTTDDAAATLLDAACQHLESTDAATLYAAASKLGLALATPEGSRQLFADAFPDEGALAKGLTDRTGAAREVSLPLLAQLDGDAALGLFIAALELGSSDVVLGRGVSHAYRTLIGRVPIDQLLALCDAGKLRPEALPAEAWEHIAPSQVLDWVSSGAVAVDYLPSEAWNRLEPAALVEAWLTGKLPFSKLPPKAKEAVDVDAFMRAFRAGGNISGIAEASTALASTLEPKAVRSALEAMTAVSRERPREASRLMHQPLVPFELDGLLRMAEPLLQDAAALPIVVDTMRLDGRLFDRLAQKIVQRGQPEGLAALAAVLEETSRSDEPLEHRPLRWPIVAAVAVDASNASARLRPYFSEEALARPRGRAMATMIASSRQAPLAADEGWAALAAELLVESPPMFDAARTLLARFDAKRVKAALKAAGHAPPSAPPPSTPELPEKRDFLKRYEAGEHEAVWAELCALEASARHPEVIEEAEAVARAMMATVRRNLETIAARLKKKKYALAAKTPKRAVAPPTKSVAKDVAALEKVLGGPLPLAMKAFYEVVGSVDLTMAAGADDALGACDPLMVIPPKLARQLLKDEADHEKQFPKELRRPLTRLPLGLDPRRKADEDGLNDDPYELVATGQGVDGEVLQGTTVSTFVETLRRAVAGGGFLVPRTGDEREWLTEGLEAF